MGFIAWERVLWTGLNTKELDSALFAYGINEETVRLGKQIGKGAHALL